LTSAEWDDDQVSVSLVSSSSIFILCFQVWHYNTFGRDEFLGVITYADSSDTNATVLKLPLQFKTQSKGSNTYQATGRVLIEVSTSHRLDAV
jgi:hypothetical protein